MKSSEIRQRFLSFFHERGHEAVASASLIPSNDPTLYFTNAGMVQFKDVFLGKDPRSYTTATTAQKCLRVSGKHNDLEEVGRTARHHTFFEMLGNFSFGDYFKAEAIKFAWDMLTIEFNIPVDKLWVTVFEDDDEAERLWLEIAGVPADRIQRLGAKDNFWSMGPTGPCGPCSEIFYDHGPKHGIEGGPETESDRYVEIWNLVFMQFNRDDAGTLTPLPRPSIDTGMGLERLAAVMQGVYSNYDTDIFQGIVQRAAALAGVTYGEDEETDIALKVIADHSRAAAFLMADGIMPDNNGRGYVLRRIMRRAIRFGVKLDLDELFLHETVDAVISLMGDAYSALADRRSFILEVTTGEESRFRRTLSKGLSLLESTIAGMPEGEAVFSGEVAFKLKDTFGFPIDLTQQITNEHGLSVDMARFQGLEKQQKDNSRGADQGSGDAAMAADVYALASAFSTDFIGYRQESLAGAEVLALLSETGARVDALPAGSSGVAIVDATPFYAESGGQTGDTGTLTGTGLSATITDTKKPAGSVFFHHVTVHEGILSVGGTVALSVNSARRAAIKLNHTATHLLHAALREVLGDHVMQKGSLVAPNRLRFDFSHPRPVSLTEQHRIEDLVCQEILGNQGVSVEEMSMDDAMEQGAMALFGEKYGERVRVVGVPGFSTELCGGTHVSATGDIGLLRITTESGVAAGVRRIEAVTGTGALSWLRKRTEAAAKAAAQLKVKPEALVDSVGRLQDDRKRLEREMDKLKAEMARLQAGDLTDGVREINGIKVLAAEMDAAPAALRNEAERLRDQLGTAVVVLGTRAGGSVKLAVMVSKDIAGKKVHAGKLVKQIAELVGGRGGGRPDMAQAGGPNGDALPAALETVYTLVGA
ncbi:MAG: alanine--tRNA ligase [Myxococcota bacterium]|nr:alanine--tRNA ligase [Myxococcota bacterium]